MEKKNVILVWLSIFLLVGVMNFVYAQENLSLENETLINESPAINSSNNTINETQISGGLFLKEIIPSSFKSGDIQFNIKFENNGTSEVNNIAPIVTGKGFSVSEVISLDKLSPGEVDYVIIMGNFRESGIITLTIKNGDKTFYYNVSVSDDAIASNAIVDIALIENLTGELEELKQKYSTMEYTVSKKKSDGFDVSGIKLDDAKKYLRSAEANLLGKDVNTAQVNLKLALEEIEDQTIKVNDAQEISSVDKLKNNAIIFSTIAGALIALFTLYELLKKKGTVAVEKVKEVKEKMGSKD